MILNHNYQYPNHLFNLCDYFNIDELFLFCFITNTSVPLHKKTLFTSENTGFKRQSASNRSASKKCKKSTKGD